MGYALAPYVYGCIADGRVAFLDLRENRYFALPQASDEIIQALVRKESVQKGGVSVLRSLTASGLLVETESDGFSLPEVGLSKPRESAFDWKASGANLAAIVHAVASRLLTARAMKSSPVHEVVDQISRRKRARKARLPKTPETDPRAPLAAYINSRRIFSKQDKCLAWSVAMVRFLSHYDILPDFVIGVKMRPFAAHAWVQCGPIVLSDTVESVQSFTPILVI